MRTRLSRSARRAEILENAQKLIAARGDELLKMIPLARFGTPAETAALALFLISRHASYITGQTIAVDGGFSNR